MKAINVTQLIDGANLNRNLLAAELFPEHKYPRSALMRLEQGSTLLDSNQMLLLAEKLGITVNELYTEN